MALKAELIPDSAGAPLLVAPPDPTRRIVASDLEGTLSAGQAWRGMRDYLIAGGRKDAYRRLQRRHWFVIMRYQLRLMRDTQSFKERWLLEMLALFAGVSSTEIQELSRFVADRILWPGRRPEVVLEVRHHLDEGARVIVVTGMFEPFLSAFLHHLPGAEGIGTPLLYEGDRFTGKIQGWLNVGERKVARLTPYLDAQGTLLAGYGDTKRDIPMLSITRQPVAVDPDRELRRVALERGWRIIESGAT